MNVYCYEIYQKNYISLPCDFSRSSSNFQLLVVNLLFMYTDDNGTDILSELQMMAGKDEKGRQWATFFIFPLTMA